MIFDAHTHLPVEGDCQNKHVVSADLDDWGRLSNLSEHNVPASIGIHPWFAEQGRGEVFRLKKLLVSAPFLNIGEIGLDYAYQNSDRRVQAELFTVQLELAIELDRLVTVHSVRAWGDMLAALRKIGVPSKGILFHGFRGAAEVVRELLLYNSFFSLGESQLTGAGIKQQQAVRVIPPDRFLLESDGAGDIEAALSLAAQIRQEDPEQLLKSSNCNFRRIFR